MRSRPAFAAAAAGLLAAVIALGVATPAHAQLSQSDLGLVDAKHPPWGDQPARWFMATRLDFGFAFFRPRVSFGYGKPHHSWLGIDVNPIVWLNGVGAWGGLRAALPYINLRVGARWQAHTFRRTLLPIKDKYLREDIEIIDGPTSRYVSLEAELTGNFRVSYRGLLNFELALSYVRPFSDGYNVYEEAQRIVIRPPWLIRTRVGYFVRLLPQGALSVGALFELLHNPGRNHNVLRVGGSAALRVRYDLDIRVDFLPVVYNTDSIGAAGTNLFLVGLRWRWATGQPLYPTRPQRIKPPYIIASNRY